MPAAAQIGGAFIPFANDSSQLSNVQGLAFGADGNFYVADEGDNGPVKSFDSTGGYLTTYATQGGNSEAVAFDPEDPNDVYVATGSTIEQINLSTHVRRSGILTMPRTTARQLPSTTRTMLTS